jgi:RHS repeat-associated protein
VSQSSPTALSVTTEYVSGMEYVDGNLQSIYHEEGRYVKNGSNWHHEYVIRDHLGNNRVFFSDTNGDGFISMSEVSQEAHYYPFGMAMEGNWLSTSLPENKYRYNGIEQTSNLGLGVYNAFYRTLDPSLGRWWQVDPEAELHYGQTPYNAMLNNPILFDDPNGDTPLHLGAAIVGGLINLGSQALKGNVTSWGEGLGYFGVGAAAGALYLTPGGQAVAGSVQAIGNKGIQIATGKFDVTEINSVGDVANLALDISGDYLMVGAAANIGSNIAGGLKGVAANTVDDAAINATVRTGRSVIRFPDGQLYINLPGGWVRYGGVAQATGKGSAIKGSATALRSFTKSNFRTNLGRLTGKVPTNAQAHHVFPQKYATRFSKAGINIHDPKFGAWWETTSHLKNASPYNNAWGAFFSKYPNPTQSQILNQGRTLMHQYGIPVGF